MHGCVGEPRAGKGTAEDTRETPSESGIPERRREALSDRQLRQRGTVAEMANVRPLAKSALALASTVILLGAAPAAEADMHRYTDKTGRIHIVDNLDDIPAEYREQVRTIATPPPKPRLYKPGAMMGSKRVDIYVTSWCGYCRKLENFLKSKRIPYQRHDIEKSSSARQAHLKMGGGGVPVVKVGSEVIRGYSPDAILRSLNKK